MSWSDLTFEEFEKIADCLGNRYMEFMDNAACDEASDTDSYGTPERDGEMAIRELLIRLEKMRAERDEARREICHDTNGISPTMVAEARGWDCFKENTDV